MGDLSIVDVEVLDIGDIWFKLDKPVEVAYTTESGHHGEGLYSHHTSCEWIIEMYVRPGSEMRHTVVSCADGKDLEKDRDGNIKTSAFTDTRAAPIEAFILFTCSIVEVDP